MYEFLLKILGKVIADMYEQLASYHEPCMSPKSSPGNPINCMAWTTWLLELSKHSQVIKNLSINILVTTSTVKRLCLLRATYSYMRIFMNTAQWNQTTAFFSMFTDEIRWTEEITVTTLPRNCL